MIFLQKGGFMMSIIKKSIYYDEELSNLYEIFDEEKRLQTKSGSVEFTTTLKYIEDVLKPNSKILDLGPGTGIYSFHYEALGHQVFAVELADRNYEFIKSKIDGHNIELYHRSAIDLSIFEDESFDIILLFGPLYHVEKGEEAAQCIAEAKRVLKKDGTLFVSFINNDFIYITETLRNREYFSESRYNQNTFDLEPYPFIFYDLDSSTKLMQDNGFKVVKRIASDGYSELLQESLNTMSDESFDRYLDYHLHFCEQESSLSATNHFLYQCLKNE